MDARTAAERYEDEIALVENTIADLEKTKEKAERHLAIELGITLGELRKRRREAKP